MSPTKISKRIVADKVEWINKMLDEIGYLPMDSFESFVSDKRNIFAAESCLRRALEALMDLGRHILAKGLAKGVSEYKEIGRLLGQMGVLPTPAALKFKELAGYKNRLVHFYHEITDKELYRICSSQINDIKELVNDLLAWLKSNPHFLDGTL